MIAAGLRSILKNILVIRAEVSRTCEGADFRHKVLELVWALRCCLLSVPCCSKIRPLSRKRRKLVLLAPQNPCS